MQLKYSTRSLIHSLSGRGWDDLFIGDELTADADLPGNHFRLQHLPTHNFYRLSLSRAEFADAGVYTCTSETASTLTGSGASASSRHVAIYNLMVVGKPECHVPYNVTEHVVVERREMVSGRFWAWCYSSGRWI